MPIDIHIQIALRELVTFQSQIYCLANKKAPDRGSYQLKFFQKILKHQSFFGQAKGGLE